MKPDFDAIRKLNKKSGKALVSNPGAQLATSASQVLSGISQATSILAANRPQPVTVPTPSPTPTSTTPPTTLPGSVGNIA